MLHSEARHEPPLRLAQDELSFATPEPAATPGLAVSPIGWGFAMNRSTSRRSLFGAAALTLGATLPAVAAPSANPDADLIKLCDAFVARDAAWCELVNALDDLEGTPEGDAIQERINALGEGYCERRRQIAEMTARTPAGWLAKARAQMQDWANEPPPGAEIAYSLVRDLVGA